MLQPMLLSSSWEGQVFYKNEGHKQSKKFTAVDQLPQTARKKLETSWAPVFYEEFFRLLDEEVYDRVMPILTYGNALTGNRS